jgi:hypothetical protein
VIGVLSHDGAHIKDVRDSQCEAMYDRKGRFMMNRKSNKLFCAALLISVLTSGFVTAGCASLNNLLNPIHVVDRNGEKIAATWNSSTRQCTIGGTAYPYQDRPAVPPAPQKPLEPNKPSPPAWSNPSFIIDTGVGDDKRHTKESYSSREELVRKINFYRAQSKRNDISHVDRAHYSTLVEGLSDDFNSHEEYQKRYNLALAQYQADLPKYQQNVAQYNKDIAEYQARLPKYQAEVDAKTKSIQAGINPNAPKNWVGYVEGKYLIYKGKAE